MTYVLLFTNATVLHALYAASIEALEAYAYRADLDAGEYRIAAAPPGWVALAP